MMEQPPKQQIKLHRLPQLGTVGSVVWLQSTQKLPFAQQEASDQHDEYLKKEHQAYLAQKLKRKQELLKSKLKQFGDSSSESDNQISIEKNATNDSSNEHQILRTFQYYSGKASSKADSQNQVTLKKIQSVHVGSSKAVENIDVLDIFINSKKGVDVWIQQNLKFKEKIIKFNDFQCSYYDMNKIKIIFSETAEKALKIKINWNNQQFIFASSRVKTHNELPQAFYIFAKIITEKLEIMNKNKYFEEKLFQFPESMMKNSLKYGRILKKSSFLNRWSSIYASITNEGLWYSKKYSDKERILARRGQITQFWTRFELEEGHFIVKLFQNSSKVQLAIPVTNFMQRNGWLYFIYDLAFKKQ